MFPGSALILVLVGLVVPVFFVLTWLISVYHRLAALSKAYAAAYARLDVELKRRYDLLLDLVEAAKGCLGEDLGSTEAILAARNAASAANRRAARAPGDAATMKDLAGSEAALAATLGRLFDLAKAHPDLETHKAMVGLREELAASELRTESARQAYNDAIMRYNLVRVSFPNSVVAIPFGFGRAEAVVAKKPASTDEQKPLRRN
jgi:LemA protein